MKAYYVYVLASRRHRHLAVGVTADLRVGVTSHRLRVSRKLGKGRVYQKLVMVERLASLDRAIGRERYLKRLPRSNLARIVSAGNPAWEPLSITAFTGDGSHESVFQNE